GDDVTALAAAEAVEQSAGRGDLEARGLLVVKGTQPLLRPTPGVAELQVAADDIVDPRAFPDRCHVLVVDPACHAGSLRRPTDTQQVSSAPPSSTPRRRRPRRDGGRPDSAGSPARPLPPE